jgi:hypothetical protein
MKTVMYLFILVLVTISFAACEKANNPVAPVTLNKNTQTYSGTFDVTYKDYKNTPHSVSVSGEISFIFDGDTYSYDAQVVNTQDNVVETTLHDQGTFSITGNKIEMYDNATRLMNPTWQPSLYLSGTYSYLKGDNQITIEGTGNFGSVRLSFNNP